MDLLYTLILQISNIDVLYTYKDLFEEYFELKLKDLSREELEAMSYDDIALPQDATVEGSHPSDYGMQVYAEAYRKKLRKILK